MYKMHETGRTGIAAVVLVHNWHFLAVARTQAPRDGGHITVPVPVNRKAVCTAHCHDAVGETILHKLLVCH